jgi:hypothetical protein
MSIGCDPLAASGSTAGPPHADTKTASVMAATETNLTKGSLLPAFPEPIMTVASKEATSHRAYPPQIWVRARQSGSSKSRGLRASKRDFAPSQSYTCKTVGYCAQRSDPIAANNDEPRPMSATGIKRDQRRARSRCAHGTRLQDVKDLAAA